MGLTRLSAVRESDESYIKAKAEALSKQATEAARATKSAAYNAKRAQSLAMVPAEPAPENGGASTSTCAITFSVGDEGRGSRRKFESDNTLQDIVHFVRSLPAVPVDSPI